MKTPDHGLTNKSSQQGLTLIELLIVVAAVVVLAFLLLPTLSSTGHVRPLRIRCLNNVKQIALGVVSDAIDNHDQLPPAPAGPNRLPWDVAWEPFERIQLNGVTRDVLHDPAFPQQNDDRLWNAATNRYRIIGYALALHGDGLTLIASNQNSTVDTNILGQTSQSGLNLSNFSERVLVADPIISLSGQNDPTRINNYQWKNIPGGLPNGTKTTNGTWHGFSTSHLDKAGKLPLGGNVGFMDGHARWHPWTNMLPRTTGAGSTPIFWW